MKTLTKSTLLVATLGLALAIGLTAPPAGAQEAPTHARPYLAGHHFTETVDVPSPFVRSFVRNRLGAGKAFDLETTIPDLEGEPLVGLKGDLIFAILDFEYQYAVKDWIALRARFVGAGRLGSDTLSLLSQGITMTTGFDFGWLIRLREYEKTALSMDLNISNRAFTGVNISQYVEDIVAGDPATLVKKTPSFRGSLGLRFAWAVSPLLGVSARAATGYGESMERTKEDEMFWRLSTCLDFDLRTKMSAPVGVGIGHTYDTFPEFGGDVAEGIHATFLRFSYLGRDDFLLSLDISHDRIPVAGDQPDLKGATVTISLRYYI